MNDLANAADAAITEEVVANIKRAESIKVARAGYPHLAWREWNRTHTKATVTVECADGHRRELGGARAGRCSYAIAYRDASGQWSVLGLRSAPKVDSNYHGRQDVVPVIDLDDIDGALLHRLQSERAAHAQASHE